MAVRQIIKIDEEETLKRVIRQLHECKSVDEVKTEFAALLDEGE